MSLTPVHKQGRDQNAHVLIHQFTSPDFTELPPNLVSSVIGQLTARHIWTRFQIAEKLGLTIDQLNYFGQRDAAGELITLDAAKNNRFIRSEYHADKKLQKIAKKQRKAEVAAWRSGQEMNTGNHARTRILRTDLELKLLPDNDLVIDQDGQTHTPAEALAIHNNNPQRWLRIMDRTLTEQLKSFFEGTWD